MRNFAKSILNYFAAFNETRFRISKRLPYEWSDDSFTLDLSVFPAFQKRLLDGVAAGDHTKNPEIVTAHNFDQEYLEYDIERQLELESYGYSFLRINKFSLAPDNPGETRISALNRLLQSAFGMKV